MKKTLSALAAGALLSVAGLASAAEPLQLSDSQMDVVSAGQSSYAISGGFALLGGTASVSNSGTYERVTWFSRTRATSASAGTIAAGVVAVSGAAAGSSF